MKRILVVSLLSIITLVTAACESSQPPAGGSGSTAGSQAQSAPYPSVDTPAVQLPPSRR